MPRVFVSYSQDSPLHCRRIRELAERLRADGIEAWIDQYSQDPDEGWPAWMRGQLAKADRVLLVFTETYARRFLGTEAQGIGLGATFEGGLATQALYESGGRNTKFRAVVFTEGDAQFIPSELRRFTHYRVDTPDHYQNLLRWLHESPKIVPPDVLPKPRLPSETTPSVERNHRDLLKDVNGEVENRLKQSLPGAVPIDLRKEKQPQQVSRTGDPEVKGGHQSNSSVPSGTQIIEVFDQEAGKLLVLGAPGAGKTTILLQLARELIARAQTDASAAIPVLLNLSSWKKDGQPLARWLEAELHSKYGVRKDIGRQWLQDRCLLPLLDGLDELEPTYQEQCVQAINQFQKDSDYRPDYLVVCCRLAEYQSCKTKLHLQGAIYLQPLTDEQVCHYLAATKHPDLWNHLQTDAELLELARSPLLLNMLAIAYETRSVQEWENFRLKNERHQYLFDAYIEHMLSRHIERKEYTKERTLHWLTWLAQRLKEHAQTDFVIEKLQPTWLPSLTQKWMYRVAVVLFVALVFGLFQWLISVDLVLPKGKLLLAVEQKTRESIGRDALQIIASSVLAIFVLVAALVVGLMQSIKPIETLQWSGARAWSGMVHGLRRWSITGFKFTTYVGLIIGQIVWTLFFLSNGLHASDWFALWSSVGKVAGVISGVVAAMAVLLIARRSVWCNLWRPDRAAVNWTACLIGGLICGITFSVTMGPLIGLVVGLSIGTIAGLAHGLSDRPVFRVVDALIVGLIGGLISGWLTGSLLPKALGARLSDWVSFWLYGWLGLGAAAGLVAGLMSKLSKKAKPAENLQTSERAVSNWLALQWSKWLIVGLVAASISSVIMILLRGSGHVQMIQGIGIISGFFGLGVIGALSTLFVTAVICAALGATLGGLVGALLEMLSGALKGPEIERRIVPNQGIRQSARNVLVFALIGGTTLGTIWGLLNLSEGVLMTGLPPDALDWIRFELSGVLFFGLFSGLVPGAACVQHFALRFILWCRGVVPWDYARFLNYATERMLLQRVGGRYRFIHELLREHFATMEPPRTQS
jgi:TIR domain